ncbi:MAG: hypothetical protein M3209_17305 [Acidobacteriota bacterium]|nr:hypothetical protein [Acidobacteriota bacterium]
MKRLILIILIITALFSLVGNAEAATYTVTNTNDNGAGSLRWAIAQANTTEIEDIINFDSQIFSTPKTITLTGGQLIPFYPVVIEGPGANLLTISGNNQSRIFFNNYSSSSLTISNLTLTQGIAVTGGAIYSSSFLRLSNLVITGNTASAILGSESDNFAGYGGGIFSSGGLIMADSIISNNLATGGGVRPGGNNYGDWGLSAAGGGIYYYTGSPAIIVNCTFINNTARGINSSTAGEGKSGANGGSAYGGALYSYFSFHIINSNFINNSAVAGNGGSIVSTTFGPTAGKGGESRGGAVFSRRTIILNSTFNNNSALAGKGGSAPNENAEGDGGESVAGAIYDLDLKMANSTIVNNTATAGNGRIGGNSSAGGFFGGGNQKSVINSTITGNLVIGGTGTQTNGLSQGGGVFIEKPGTGDTPVSFHNNIVAENTATTGTDIFAESVIAANNLIGIGGGAPDLLNGVNGNLVGTVASPIDPKLAPLGDNGGLTKTRALLSGSPAINAGKHIYAINPFDSQSLQFDQRGLQRIVPDGGGIDMGAFELNSSTVPATGHLDLQRESDTGPSDVDNTTKARAPVLEISDVIPGAKVELLRNNQVVSSATATSVSVRLTDPNPPFDGTVEYFGRQTIGGAVSAVSYPLAVTFDHTAPTVTINQEALQTDPATSLPIRFNVVFSEPAVGLEREDISFAGSTADLSSAGMFILATSPSTYTIEIYGLRSTGTVVAALRQQAAYDRVGNSSSASTSTDNSVDFQPNIIGVSVSGRIRRNSGLLKTPAMVTFTDRNTGEIWTARTNPFGYYNFTGLKIYQGIGNQFTVQISNKSFFYYNQLPVMITGNRNNLNFIVP